MYDPVKDGVAKTATSVVYDEIAPPDALRELVHCFWRLRTVTDLDADFTLHAMPDACVNLLCNQRDTRIAGLVAPKPVTAAILVDLDHIRSVGDMAEVAGLSPRQLQRALQATTGFAPHDLLKVLRLQHSFRRDYLMSFADQSHCTRSFRTLTGYTPARFDRTFDV